MNEAERIEKLTGEVAALNAFCLALIGAYPDRAELARHFNGLVESLTAQSLAMPVPELRLQGMRDFASGLQEAIRRYDELASAARSGSRPAADGTAQL
ncbi:hypothetical protein VAR608DRAFT_4899 [Variovorax sp. HW608]|uniref:hypothetical protein n=1 Tax=Variovorax sp. HW608 TaxID=1034889 RepID=UPI00081FC39E|nr:hypothetical protein [Variovorax sp. HW608]SCK49239.1 hypothetical protein VAR608DRAFT_4899 [Variovorax sp. HW608]